MNIAVMSTVLCGGRRRKTAKPSSVTFKLTPEQNKQIQEALTEGKKVTIVIKN